MDQYASALAQAGHALLIDCRSLEAGPVPLPPGIAIVVIDSKIERRLADTPYNRRREECAEAARILGLDSLRDATPEMLSRLEGNLLKRARHVVTENARVITASTSFFIATDPSFLNTEAHDLYGLDRIGLLMAASHASIRDDFEASCPEIDLLVELANDNGVVGARVTGAGWGGCTVNLVREDAVESFSAKVATEYNRRTRHTADAHVCRAVDGMRVTDV
jgi:galactokinase